MMGAVLRASPLPLAVAAGADNLFAAALHASDFGFGRLAAVGTELVLLGGFEVGVDCDPIIKDKAFT